MRLARYVELRTHLVALIAGCALVCVGLVVGWLVTAVGAQRTGELALDRVISQHRGGVGGAVGMAVQVGVGPLAALLMLLVACVVVWRRDRAAAVITAVLTSAGWLSVVGAHYPADVAGSLLLACGTILALVSGARPAILVLRARLGQRP